MAPKNGSRRRATLATWVGSVVCAVGICGTVGGTASAVGSAASGDGSVEVPLHSVTTDLTLVGASSAGVAVQQSPVIRDVDSNGAVYTGALGGTLTRDPVINAALTYRFPGQVSVHGVVGDSVGWSEFAFGAGHQIYTAHRLDLTTGVDVEDGEMPLPEVFTGNGWLSANAGYLEPPTPGNPDGINWFHRPLVRYTPGGGTDGVMGSATLLDEGEDEVAIAADTASALVATADDEQTSPRLYHLDLISFGTGAVQRLLDTPEVISSVALSQDTLAWDTQAAGAARQIHQRSRTSSASTSYTETNAHADGASLALGSDGVGYLVDDPAGTFLRVVDGSSARRVDLPLGGSGLAAVGGAFLTATGGPVDTAGVYRIEGTTVTRAATVPSGVFRVQALAFSNSRLYYADWSKNDLPGLPVWRHTVSGEGTPELSAASLLTPRADTPEGPTGPQISFSAGRGVISVPGKSHRWRLIDRGVTTAFVQQRRVPTDYGPDFVDATAKTSGPYTLIGGQVFRADGELVYTEPRPGRSGGPDDLFGSTILYSRVTHHDRAEVWLVDARKGRRVLLNRQLCSDPVMVAIWADSVAWLNCAETAVTVQNLTTKTIRRVPSGSGDGYVNQLLLGEGTLVWLVNDGPRGLDLTTPTSTPVALTGPADAILLDDHRVARQLSAAAGAGVQLDRLPFAGAYRPRLIGRLGPLGFSPNADGRADAWRPQFDVTKPLSGATLRITQPRSGRVVRTLEGTAPDGSIRDLVWDGRTGAGATAATGTYRWTLSGAAADGDGPLISANGAMTITGTVELNRN
jgi:hypothetical protein